MPDLSIRPLVRRRGSLWSAVCWACRTRTTAVELPGAQSAAAEHASTEEHQTRVREELIRIGVADLAQRRKARAELLAQGVTDEDIQQSPMSASSFWEAHEAFTRTVCALAELLLALGEEDEKTAARVHADELIRAEHRSLDALNLAEAA